MKKIEMTIVVNRKGEELFRADALNFNRDMIEYWHEGKLVCMFKVNETINTRVGKNKILIERF